MALELTRAQLAKLDAAAPLIHEPVVKNFATDVNASAMKWLWRPYLPLGKLCIVAGAPGHGKSQLTAMFASAVTRGSFYPTDVIGPGRCLILSAEDDTGDTVKPRLLAANADVSLVDTIEIKTTYPDGLTGTGMIRIPGDVGNVHRFVRDHPDTRLVVLDPVASFFGRDHSTYSNQDVRDALGPLNAIAQQYGVTVVLILHLNKSSEVKEWSARIAESHGFQAIARSVMALGPDPDDEDGEAGSLKVLALTKANLVGKGSHAMRAEIVEVEVEDSEGAPIMTSKLKLTGSCDVSPEDLLMTREQRDSYQAASEWLLDYLGDEWIRVGNVQADAIKAGHNWRTVERVRRERCQRQKQPGIKHGPWWIAKKDISTSPTFALGVGGLGGLENSNGVKAANTAQTQSGSVAALTTNGQDRQGRSGVVDLGAYRAFEQRRLGERDDDDA